SGIIVETGIFENQFRSAASFDAGRSSPRYVDVAEREFPIRRADAGEELGLSVALNAQMGNAGLSRLRQSNRYSACGNGRGVDGGVVSLNGNARFQLHRF